MEKPRKNKILQFAARNPESMIAVLAAFSLVYFSSPSIGLSPDSITYTSVARNLTSGHGPYEFDGVWLTDFPLAYPSFLALVTLITGLDPFRFGLVLNALLFAALVFVCLREMQKNDFPLFVRCICALCLLLSAPLLQVFSMLWSETLFIFLTGIFMASACRYGKTHHAGAFWVMTASTAIACVTRYAGVTLLGMGLLLLLTDRICKGRKKWRFILLYGISGFCLLLANLILNRIYGGGMTGERLTNHTPLIEHLGRFGVTLMGWLPLRSSPAFLSIPCSIGLIGGATVFSIVLLYRRKNLYSWASLGLLFTAIYSLFILAMASLTAFQPLDSRLLSPLWFPLVAVTGGALQTLWRRHKVQKVQKNHRGWIPVSLALSIALLVTWSGASRAISDIHNPQRVYADPARFDFDRLKSSPTLRFIRDHTAAFSSSDKPVYSNAAELLYAMGGLETNYLPRLDAPDDLENFNADSGYLVWLYDIHAYPDFYLSRLKKASQLSLAWSFNDGAIFSVVPR